MKTLFEAVKNKAMEYGFEVSLAGAIVLININNSNPISIYQTRMHIVVVDGGAANKFIGIATVLVHLDDILSQHDLNRDLSEQTTEVVDSPTNTPKVAHSANGEDLGGIEATLAERQAQYGDFKDVAATTERLFAELKGGASFVDLSNEQRMAMYMICSKMARIVNGDVNHRDGWHDIGGYSKLIEDSLVAKK